MPNWNPVADKVNRGCRLPADFPLEAYGSGSATRVVLPPVSSGASIHAPRRGQPSVNAVASLESTSPASANVAGIGQIFSGPALTRIYNAPGIPPNGDSRTPDILVTPNIGVTYSGSGKKLAEHGDFAHDDTNVMMLLSNPSFDRKRITSPVGTMQIAPTILKALGLDPDALDAVRLEGTEVLPGLDFGDGH